MAGEPEKISIDYVERKENVAKGTPADDALIRLAHPMEALTRNLLFVHRRDSNAHATPK